MKYGWEQFRIALGFLTVLPVDRSLEATPMRLGRSMALFPAVGLTLGLCLVVIDNMLGALIPRAVLDFLLLLILVIITGALHLDGIAGLLSGLAKGKDREGLRTAMHERRVGAIGVVGLVMLLFFKYLCLFNLPLSVKSACLIFMPAAGRWIQVVLAVSCRHLRSQEAGGDFLEHVGERELLIACSSLIVVAVVLFGLKGIFLAFLLGIAAAMLIKYFELRLGGVTGDILGAATELMEAFSLLIVLAVISP
jgi:adenosylcobinamide-GDP ribazoletransferase